MTTLTITPLLNSTFFYQSLAEFDTKTICCERTTVFQTFSSSTTMASVFTTLTEAWLTPCTRTQDGTKLSMLSTNKTMSCRASLMKHPTMRSNSSTSTTTRSTKNRIRSGRKNARASTRQDTFHKSGRVWSSYTQISLMYSSWQSCHSASPADGGWSSPSYSLAVLKAVWFSTFS